MNDENQDPHENHSSQEKNSSNNEEQPANPMPSADSSTDDNQHANSMPSSDSSNASEEKKNDIFSATQAFALFGVMALIVLVYMISSSVGGGDGKDKRLAREAHLQVVRTLNDELPNYLSSIANEDGTITVNTREQQLELVRFQNPENIKTGDWMLESGANMQSVRIPVTYQYQVSAQKPWSLDIRGNVARVIAPPLLPELSPEVNFGALMRQTSYGWKNMPKEEASEFVADLQDKLTRQAYQRYLDGRSELKEEARREIQQMVMNWLSEHPSYGDAIDDPDYGVVKVVLREQEEPILPKSLEKAENGEPVNIMKKRPLDEEKVSVEKHSKKNQASKKPNNAENDVMSKSEDASNPDNEEKEGNSSQADESTSGVQSTDKKTAPEPETEVSPFKEENASESKSDIEKDAKESNEAKDEESEMKSESKNASEASSSLNTGTQSPSSSKTVKGASTHPQSSGAAVSPLSQIHRNPIRI